MLLRLILLFTTIPIIELWLFLTLGKTIGIFETILIIIVTGVLGATLTKKQGMDTLSKFQRSFSGGNLPHEELTDGILILLAGAVLLTPGFLTDAVGFALLIPPLRAIVKTRVAAYLKEKVLNGKIKATVNGQPINPSSSSPNMRSTTGRVVDVEVLD